MRVLVGVGVGVSVWAKSMAALSATVVEVAVGICLMVAVDTAVSVASIAVGRSLVWVTAVDKGAESVGCEQPKSVSVTSKKVIFIKFLRNIIL